MPGAFSSKRHFLFDLDGTLIDSTAAHARAYVQALSAAHPALAEKFEYMPFAGWPTRPVFSALGLPDNEAGTLTSSKQRLYRDAIERGEVNILPGVRDLLQRLAELERQLFIVTGASRLSAEQALRATGIAPYFAGVVAAEDTRQGKPSPEPYLHALKIHGLAPADCLAIEDGEGGFISARAAGLDVVLIHTDLVFQDVISLRSCHDLAKLISP